ncbi:MAG TPA: peptidoglycan bridge formation glycyltransferase FemA/FemB family protein [Anaerolineae bacterium]
MSSFRVVTPGAHEWDAFVTARPDAHILQTSAWGELKSRFGWSAERIAVTRDDQIAAGALVLFRRLPMRLGTLAYIPKGPIVDLADRALIDTLLTGLDALARRRRAILLKVEPDTCDAQPFARLGFRPSPHSVQPPRTILIDIARGEDDILAAMHPKTRYNIRLADKKSVAVRATARSDLPAFNALMQATSSRDGFAVHSPAYYEAAFDLFVAQGRAQLFLAEVESHIVAGLFAFALGERAWYFYGASGDAHREKMPNHALQWRAIRWARSIGCRVYDVWGIPDEDEATLDAQYLNRHAGLWGVYRFKRGFGGEVVRFAGALDRVYNPLLYRAYRLALKVRGNGE